MASEHYQPGILDIETFVLEVVDADIEYRTDFIESDQAWRLFDQILAETAWRQETVKVYGKRHLTPRLSCWVGEPWMTYSYSNAKMTPQPWTSTLLEVKRELERQTEQSFNSVLVNYYRDGQDSNGWHSDNEPELGIDPVIASISLGASRDFQLRHRADYKLKRSIKLQHGSLLVMQGKTQACWQHCIPKRAQSAPRINLTFRTIINRD